MFPKNEDGSSVMGEKNHGFDVLYHNMKHGQTSVKDLQDFVRESANAEEMYAKHMTKLAKLAANCSQLGTFSPLMDVFKVMTEKLSSCHMDIVLKLQDIIKDLSKYLEEQKNKHKQMKDELNSTAEALHNIQTTTSAVSKSKEKYHQLCVEAERLKRTNAVAKDIDKVDIKSKKAADEYRSQVEKYSSVREQFEKKMVDSTKAFQDIEEHHLRHMKTVLDSYILSFENANVLISQVHQEFKRQVSESTIDRLIQQYSEQKGTGTERPGPLFFEECDPAAILATMENGTHNHTTATENNQTQGQTRNRKEPSGLFGLRRRKQKQKNDASNVSVSSKESNKDAESMESPDKENDFKVDEEGYTIRPEETDRSEKGSFKFSSSDSDSDSDSDDAATKKIQVRIKPKEATDSGGSDLETLNAITKNLTLGSPSPLGGKKPLRVGSTHLPSKPEWHSPLRHGKSTRISRREHTLHLEQSSVLRLTPSPPDRTWSHTSDSAVPNPRPSDDILKTVLLLPRPNSLGIADTISMQSSSISNTQSTGVSPRLHEASESKESSPSRSESESGTGTPVPAPRKRASVIATESTDVPKELEKGRVDFKGQPDISVETFTDAPVARKRVASLISARTDSVSKPKSNIASHSCLTLRKLVEQPKKEPHKKSVKARAPLPPSFPDTPIKTIQKPVDFDSTAETENSDHWVNFEANFVEDPAKKKPTIVEESPSQWPDLRLEFENKTNSDKSSSLSTVSKSEKLTNKELLDLFATDNETKPSTGATAAPSISGNDLDSFDPFGISAKPTRKSSLGKGPAPLPPTTLPHSSSAKSFDDTSSISDTETSNKPEIDIPPPRPPKPASVASPVLPNSFSSRPNDLILNNMNKPTSRGGTPSFSAPLASSESWSSLSSAGTSGGVGTPSHALAENFTSSFASVSRGPSPLAISHTDPIPIAVAFTETVNAYFKGTDNSRSLTKTTGEVHVSFPAGITRAFTSNPNPPILGFRIRCPNANVISNITHDTLLIRDTTDNHAPGYSFSFDMPMLVAKVRKMTEADPNSPHYNVHIISYQVPCKHDSMPLHVTSFWKCDPDTTEININYKYNSFATSAAFRSFSVIVPVDGGVTASSSTPQANWNEKQNRLYWQLPGVLSSAADSGTLQSTLKVSAGPSKPTTLAVQFMSEGSNLSGADFELTGVGYRLSLIKKRIITGKYLSES